MKTVKAARWDELDEESVGNFVSNMLWGMWVGNEYVNIRLVCGNCGAITETTVREKERWADCSCCEARNVL